MAATDVHRNVESAGGSFHATSGGGLVWRRFRKDRAAFAALIGLILILLMCFVVEPILVKLLGHGPDEPFPTLAISEASPHPAGWWTHVDTGHGTAFLLLGGDGPLQRDEFLRVLAGGQVSLEIAFIATMLALLIGVLLGTLAGYFGGIVDTVISRITELFMSFPLLLLVIALGQTAAQRYEYWTLHGLLQPGILALAIVIGLFSWFYPARVVRTLVVSLREQEFVEAAHMVGARDLRIIRRELLPHLSGPLIVWGTLVGAAVIVLEASLSVLNFGVRLGTASWGSMLAQSWGTLLNYNPNQGSAISGATNEIVKFAPVTALFLTVLCLALVGDGLRSALDPRSER
jgi:ABC-type dipeptide/oligopeptide/nickel transport system permease subunit